jgi:hypothetical protein
MLLWAGLLCPLDSNPALLKSHAQNCPDSESSSALEKMLESPEEFIGCKIVVEGALEKEAEEGLVFYALRTGTDRTLAVWPWAPEENDPSQDLKSSNITKTMSHFIGRQLRIAGRLVKELSGRVVLEASIVEEIGEGGAG